MNLIRNSFARGQYRGRKGLSVPENYAIVWQNSHMACGGMFTVESVRVPLHCGRLGTYERNVYCNIGHSAPAGGV